jgi:electron transport complex protein RnfB
MNEVDKINKILPQTQCQRCGYASCKPYAKAIIFENEEINRCPPGGNEVMEKLAEYMDLEKKPINPECGIASNPSLLFIDESQCIGCGLCIPACPVDAIAGAFKFMHTILKEECTGCELCISPCPVDCIKVTSRPLELSWNSKRAENSRLKFETKEKRELKNNACIPSIESLDQLKKKFIKKSFVK